MAAAQSEAPESALPPQSEAGAISEAGSERDPAPPARQGIKTTHRYDFSQPTSLSAKELRRLQAYHEEFLRAVATRLANYFRLEVELSLSSIGTITFHNFAESLAKPTHLTLFKAEPLRGICVLETEPALALAMADRLLGGSGHCAGSPRELSEIESTLLDHVVQLITHDWCSLWAKWEKCSPVLLGHESDGRYLLSSPPEATVLPLKVEVRFGDSAGGLQMAFPFSTLEPLFRHVRQELNLSLESPNESAAPKPLQWNKILDDMKISISAELPALNVPARQISRLKVGDVLPLPADFTSGVRLRLAGLSRFIGRLGTREGQWAVEVTTTVKT